MDANALKERVAERFYWEDQNLAPWAYLSQWAQEDETARGRTPDSYRTPFQRDRDRILNCSYFRQLATKTQVYTYFHSDLFRRRLTHTLEVHRLATTLANFLYVNDDLVTAIAFGHDVGHVPFGHGGELVIKDVTEFKDFTHARHGLRVVEVLADDHFDDNSPVFGLGLTFPTREGMLKHSGIKDSEGAEATLRPGEPPTIEGQLIQMADLIASFLADFEDSIQAELISLDELNGVSGLLEYLRKYSKEPGGDLRPITNVSKLRSRLTWALMQDAIDTSRELLSKFPGGGGFLASRTGPGGYKVERDRSKAIEFVRNPGVLLPNPFAANYIMNWVYPSIVRLSPEGQEVAKQLWLLREELVWHSPLVERMNEKARLVVSSLVNLFRKNPRLMHHRHKPYRADLEAL